MTMNLNRKQLSLIITIFTMANVILLAYSIRLGSKQEDEYVIEMAQEDILEELLEEEIKKLEEIAQNDPIKTHRAFNETAKNNIKNPEPLKTLQELMAEREMNESSKDFLSNDAGYAANLKALAKKREEKKNELGEREAQKKEYTQNLSERRTTISFSLVDRNAYDLPPPIYTCIRGGKVVINIQVAASGYVIDASFNAKSSNTNDYCLIENALAYAQKARFNSASKTKQLGTITYLFQSKKP
jgi:TonB family protein